MAKYTITERGHTLHVFKRTDMSDANVRFQNSLEFHRDNGFVFANEEQIDIILGSKLAAKDDDYEHVRDYPFYD